MKIIKNLKWSEDIGDYIIKNFTAEIGIVEMLTIVQALREVKLENEISQKNVKRLLDNIMKEIRNKDV